MDRPFRLACEERDFTDAVGVEVSETGHVFVHDSLQVSLLYVAVSPIYAVLRKAAIRHLVWALEPERLRIGGPGKTQILDDRLVLPHPQELENYHGLSTCASNVTIGMTGFFKSS